jgi:hypothetical protein
LKESGGCIIINDPTPTLPLEGREQVCGRLIKFSIYYGQFFKVVVRKKAYFLVDLPPPLQGEGWGGVTGKAEMLISHCYLPGCSHFILGGDFSVKK